MRTNEPQTQPTIRAIETEYAGQRFRSRLEARWAVFMDALRVPWLYEPEGFELPSGARYLPDFWLPEMATWLEIKPAIQGPGDQCVADWPRRGSKWTEFSGCCAAGLLPGRAVYLAGSPGASESRFSDNCVPLSQRLPVYPTYCAYVECDYHQLWTLCPDCGAVAIAFEGRGGRVGHKDLCPAKPGAQGYDPWAAQLQQAYSAAMQARFGVFDPQGAAS